MVGEEGAVRTTRLVWCATAEAVSSRKDRSGWAVVACLLPVCASAVQERPRWRVWSVHARGSPLELRRPLHPQRRQRKQTGDVDQD